MFTAEVDDGCVFDEGMFLQLLMIVFTVEVDDGCV